MVCGCCDVSRHTEPGITATRSPWKIMELRDQRKTTSHLQSKEISFQNAKTVSSQRLIFCRPGEHKQWLRDWHDEIHGQCLRESDIYMMLRTWWSKFWVTRYRSDYIWCNSLHELLDEIDYVLSSMTLLEYNLCVSALPLSIAFQSDKWTCKLTGVLFKKLRHDEPIYFYCNLWVFIL